MPSILPILSSRPFRVVWIVGGLGVLLGAVLAGWFWREARRLDQLRFDQITHRLTEDLDTHTEKIEAMLRDLARVMSARAELSPVDWDEFMNRVSPAWNFPGVAAIGYATNHGTASRLEFMEPWLRERNPRPRAEFYTTHPLLSQTQRWSLGLLDVYREDLQPVSRFARRDKTRHAEGMRFTSHRFQELLEPYTFQGECVFNPMQVADTNNTLLFRHYDTKYVHDAIVRDDVNVMRAHSMLRHVDARPFPGITMMVPVAHPRQRECWQKLTPLKELSAQGQWLRWQLNNGLLLACLDYHAILEQIHGSASREVEVDIYASTNLVAENRVNPKPGSEVEGMGHAKAPSEGAAAFSRRQQWPMYSHRWQLLFRTTPVFEMHSTRCRAWWAGGLGLAVTALFCWALAVQTHGRLLEARRSAELQEARDALQAAQRQRQQFSHDLHDGAVQSLYAIQLGLTRAGREVEAAAPDAAHRLSESRASLDAVIGELREFITEMEREEAPRPTTALAAALESLVRRLRPASSVPIELRCEAEVTRQLTSAQAVQLAAIAREAISNSLRHARARKIEVSLTNKGASVVLEIADDGVGFDPMNGARRGLGLGTMKSRAEKLGAAFHLDTGEGRGTSLRVCLPVHPQESRA